MQTATWREMARVGLVLVILDEQILASGGTDDVTSVLAQRGEGVGL